jgi:hypothetical protein
MPDISWEDTHVISRLTVSHTIYSVPNAAQLPIILTDHAQDTTQRCPPDHTLLLF